MDTLIAGYRSFRANVWPERRRSFELLADRGQKPPYAVICCCDSRVDPGMIFSTAPGEIFVIRNVANLVPPYQPDGEYHGTSAALEFAVRALKVAEIVVLGHAMCGGVAALVRDDAGVAEDFVLPWMQIASRARPRVLACEDPTKRQLIAEHETVRISLENLRTFPWIREAIEAGTLRVRGAHFDIRSGVLSVLKPDDSFAPV